jgi:hypothetical protein
MDNSGNVSTPAPAVSSAFTRITNVFASPSELYAEVASAPAQTTSWLMPLLAIAILAVFSSYAVYNNADLRQQIFAMQQKGFQKSVADGKMTQEQANTMSDRMENTGPVMFIIFGSLIGFFPAAGVLFLGTLLIWLIVKLGLKSPASYSKLLETYGLTQWIGLLGGIVGLILINVMNSMTATPSAGLLLGESFDMMNKGHRLLGSLNVFTLWQFGVFGVGIAKVAGKSVGTGMLVSYGVWAAGILLIVALS